jgi:hypothetical protein
MGSLVAHLRSHRAHSKGSPVHGRLRLLAPGYCLLLAFLALGPALSPGFVLTYDMVFTPRQDMLPAWLGVGGGLPRAVPQDALVAAATVVMDGAWLQKLILVGTFVLIGVGAARLAERAWLSVHGESASTQRWAAATGLIAASLAIWNPYVAQRLVQGHWSLLIAYGIAFWAIGAAMSLRQQGAGARIVVLLMAAAAITPFGGLLVFVLIVPVVLFPGGVITRGQRIGVVLGAMVVNLPWVLPSLLHPQGGFTDPSGAAVFALRSEGPWGPVVTALGGGGIWNAEVVLPSRGWWTSAVLTCVIVVSAAFGWWLVRSRTRSRLWDFSTVNWWLATALVGLSFAVVTAFIPGVGAGVGVVVPGGGLLRDSARLLAPWVMVLAVFGAVGLMRAVFVFHGRHRDRIASSALVALLMAIPLVAMPDFAWGAQGRLAAVAYPPSWQEVREYLSDDPATADVPGDVLVLPWSTFRTYEFNAFRTVLDPLPRWLTRSTVVSDDLPVAQGDDVVVIRGDDPRSRVISAAIAQDTPLASVLPSIGVRWVVVDPSQRPAVTADSLRGLDLVLETAEFLVYEVRGNIEITALPRYAGLVIAVDVLVVAALIAVVLSLAAGTLRQITRPPPAKLHRFRD